MSVTLEIAYTRRVLLPYLWLSLAIVWLWLPPQAAARGLWSRFGFSAVWLALAIAHAYATGIVSVAGVVAIAVFGLLCYACSRETSRPLDILLTLVTIVFSLALMAHVVPGFSNTLIVRDAVLTPGAVPYTSTFALTNVTLPYIVELGGKGFVAALRGNPALAKGLNVCQGRIVHPAVAESVGENATPLESVLA